MERPDSYRKDVALSEGVEYTSVNMGPIPEAPDWHQELYADQSYLFPTEAAAERFAKAHTEPGRRVVVLYPDGRRWEL